MATQQLFLYNDNSTFALFFQWANACDAWFATNGWVQSNDTGQWMRSGMSITAVAVAGSNMTCTYTSLTGAALQVGQALTVTGWTGGNVGNNGTFVITGLGAGTWTAVNASAVVVASGGTGVVTANSSVPGSGAFVYSIWQPNDGLTNFYVKMEYGNHSGQTNDPEFGITIGTGTSGAGVITGLSTGRFWTNRDSQGTQGTATTFDCRFTASPGRIGMMMWRNVSQVQVVSIERSINSSGTYTGSYVTFVLGGWSSGASSNNPASQVSLVFGVGAVQQASVGAGGRNYGYSALVYYLNNNGLCNNTVPFNPIAPFVGYYDYPMTNIGFVPNQNSYEGMIISVTIYGTPHSYIMTNSGSLQFGILGGGPGACPYFCFRVD